ncbi:MAG: hypothetical protein DMF42_03630 [Verrucomicrobia bacterium]|nr:MAG: hypothetical protein DME74_01955 [Verrucomicrobiota bacterium]PYL43583.1 MAG: hypothetical protein DMF42_03630 [Verrucomicrobiota bacterium]
MESFGLISLQIQKLAIKLAIATVLPNVFARFHRRKTLLPVDSIALTLLKTTGNGQEVAFARWHDEG